MIVFWIFSCVVFFFMIYLIPITEREMAWNKSAFGIIVRCDGGMIYSLQME